MTIVEDQILDQVLKDSLTLTEANKKLRVLKTFISDRIFNSNLKDEDVEAESEWLNSLDKQLLDRFTEKNLNKTFEKALEKLQQKGVLVIYFAFEPSRDLLLDVANWLRKNISPTLLFDSKYDPTLIAGCAFVWKGVYHDYSIRGKIADNRKVLLEMFKRSVKEY